MSDTNIAVVSGRLVEDPREVGQSGCKFTVAVNRVVGKGDDKERYTTYMPVLVWNKQASSVLQYLTKGRRVLVEGRLEQRTYERKDGSKAKEVSVVANNVQFLDSGNSAVKEDGSSDRPQKERRLTDSEKDEGMALLAALLDRSK